MLDLLASPYLILFARLCLGGVLIVGAIGKLLDARNTPAALVEQVPFLPPALARPAAALLPWVELVVGALLVLGLGLFPTGLVAALMMLVFTGVVVRDVAQNRRTPCQCFGRFSKENVSELTVLRDLFLLVLAGLIVLAPSGYLALDGALQSSATALPAATDAIPVVFMATAAVFIIILGGALAELVRGFRRLI